MIFQNLLLRRNERCILDSWVVGGLSVEVNDLRREVMSREEGGAEGKGDFMDREAARKDGGG